MPILEIVCDEQAVSEDLIMKVKQLGSLIGYDDPRKVWASFQRGIFLQRGIVYVKVLVKESDYRHENFQLFCDTLAGLLRETLGRSVEVVVPGGVPMLPVSLALTKEGEEIYKD